MISFIIRRLIPTVFLLILVSMITFAIFFLVPRLAGQTTYQLAAQYVGRNPIPSEIRAVEAKLGLNDPLYLQYGRYLKGIVFGVHYSSRHRSQLLPVPVLRLLVPQPAAGLAAADERRPGHAVAGHRGVGALADRRGVHRRAVSRCAGAASSTGSRWAIALAGVSLPVFFTGLIALELFSYKWPIFPNVHYVPFTTNPLLWARNLVLPWVTLAFLYAALYARLTRAGMLETMGEDYIRTARAKGLPEQQVVVKHGLRAALTPIVTIFGLDLGLLLGGAMLTETTFSLHGLGQFTIQAIQNQDLPEIMGVVMLASFFIVIANLVVDILYAVRRPEGAVLMAAPCSRSATCGSTSRPTTAWSRPWTAFSFSLERGRTLGIVGESGSGKSVTSLGIMGLHQGTKAEITGEILLDGEDLVAASPARVRELRGVKMAMIFQDPLSSLHPYYTVGDQIIEAYRIHNRREQEAGPPARHRPARPGRHPAALGPGGRLPAPVLRRHAAAGDDRDGAVLRSRAADRGRAHHGARRHRAGADPRPDLRPAVRVRLGGHHHHPRSRRGRRAGRRHPGDVRGPGGRVRVRRGHLRPARTIRTPGGCWPRCRAWTGSGPPGSSRSPARRPA